MTPDQIALLIFAIYVIGFLFAFCFFTAENGDWHEEDIFASFFWPILAIMFLISVLLDLLAGVSHKIYRRGKK